MGRITLQKSAVGGTKKFLMRLASSTAALTVAPMQGPPMKHHFDQSQFGQAAMGLVAPPDPKSSLGAVPEAARRTGPTVGDDRAPLGSRGSARQGRREGRPGLGHPDRPGGSGVPEILRRSRRPIDAGSARRDQRDRLRTRRVESSKRQGGSRVRRDLGGMPDHSATSRAGGRTASTRAGASSFSQKSTVPASELTVASACAASTMGARSPAPHRRTATGDVREPFLQAAHGIAHHGRALAAKVKYADRAYPLRR